MHKTMLDRALAIVQKTGKTGDLLEFGTYKGQGLSLIAAQAQNGGLIPSRKIFAFDTFCGMPKSEVSSGDLLDDEWGEGELADTSVDIVKKQLKSVYDWSIGVSGSGESGLSDITLVPGEFGKWLGNGGGLEGHGVDGAAFVHIDADIYEGYRDALALISGEGSCGSCRSLVGTVILCDESEPVAHQGYFWGMKKHGQRALREWEAGLPDGAGLYQVKTSWSIGLYVVVDVEWLEKWGEWAILNLVPDALDELLLPENRSGLINLGDGRDLSKIYAERVLDLTEYLMKYLKGLASNGSGVL